MKKFLLLLMLLPLNVFAEEEPWHMISFGRHGFGWAGTVEKINTKSDSAFNGVDYYLSDLALNYAYRLNERWQLGGYYEGYHSEYDFKTPTGISSLGVEVNSIGFFLLYNLSEDLNDSWYLGYSFGITSYEEENSHAFANAEGKSPFELDDLSQSHELIVGKRFSLRGFNVENLAYSPQIRFLYRSHGKDFDDQSVGNGKGIGFQPIRFDLLF